MPEHTTTGLRRRIASIRERMLARLPEDLARIDWPREKLDAYRQDRLREVLAHAIGHSAWHRERLAHVDPSTFRLEDLRELPVMSKADLIDDFDALSTDPRVTKARCEAHLERREGGLLDDEFVVAASGGTTGVRHIVAMELEAMAESFLTGLPRFLMRYRLRSMGRFKRALLGLALRSGIRPGRGRRGPEPPFVVGSAPGHHGGNVLQQVVGSGESRSASVVEPIDDIVAALNAADPSHLVVFSSFIPRLAEEAKAGRLRIRPSFITPSAESFLPEHEAAVEEAWQDCVIMSGWAATETAVLAAGSGFQPGMLLLDDMTIVEPVDAAGAPVPPGVMADKVFVTPLRPRTVPLVRYELTDQLTVLDGPARCGSSFTPVSYVRGRQDEEFVYPGGIAVHAHTFRTVMSRQRAISEYQIEQTPAGAHVRAVLAASASDIDREGIAAQLAERLAHVGVRDARVEVSVVEEIRRTGAGKLRRFLPLKGSAVESEPTAPGPRVTVNADGV